MSPDISIENVDDNDALALCEISSQPEKLVQMLSGLKGAGMLKRLR